MAGKSDFLLLSTVFVLVALTGCAAPALPSLPATGMPAVPPTATTPPPTATGPALTPTASPARALTVLASSTPWLPTEAPVTAPAGTVSEASTAVPVATPSRTPAPEVSPVPSAASSMPAPSAGGSNLHLTGPLLVDGPGQRMYGPARRGGPDGTPVTAALSTQDAGVIDVYPISGLLALDAARHRLYVDQGALGLAVIDTAARGLVGTLPLPPVPAMQRLAAPQVDPATGQVLVMRDNRVLALDAATGQVLDTISFDMRPQDNCRAPHDMVLPIDSSMLDGSARILYLGFVTYTCTPYVGYTLVGYDLAQHAQLGALGVPTFEAAAAGGGLYVSSWERLGSGALTAWRAGKTTYRSVDWSGGPDALQVDAGRGRLYQLVPGSPPDLVSELGLLPEAVHSSLRVFELDTMRLLAEASLPVAGRLAGYDPSTDQLYLLDGGRIRGVPAAGLESPPLSLPTAAPLAQPVAQLVVPLAPGPTGAAFGVWGHAVPMGQCYVLGQMGGLLYAGAGSEPRWTPARAGLPPACPYVTALAASPAYARDRTLLAGVAGAGVYRSADGGQSWRPASAGLPSMAVSQILLSPGFAEDRVAFAQSGGRSLLRSDDGGEHWQTLGIQSYGAALSPEFDRDQTVAAIGLQPDGNTTLLLSRDRGDSWSPARSPGSQSVLSLSLAPLFARWNVMFAFAGDGTLFRSADAGQTWQGVLAAGRPNLMDGQFAYGPGETAREVFFLARAVQTEGATSVIAGGLFRSRDGGETWEEVNPGAGIMPAALAISPDFVHDGLIALGTADGRVVYVGGMALPKK